MKTKIKLSESAAQRLLVGIIRQAVEDYRAFEERGLIVNGRVVAPVRPARGRRNKTVRGWFAARHECKCLVKFFRPGGQMDWLLAAGGLCVSGDAIRDRLGFGTNAE